MCAEQIHHGDGEALEMGVGNGSSGLMAFAFLALSSFSGLGFSRLVFYSGVSCPQFQALVSQSLK